MEKLIRNRGVVPDNWQWIKADAADVLPDVPAEGDVIVPLALWCERNESLRARKGRTAVWLDVSEGPELIAGDLAALPLVALHFPAVGDGRALTTAHLLRERYGYRGEIRAVGEVVRDLLLFMARCGIDAFALRADQEAESALGAFDELPESYQPSAVEPLPLFRRRSQVVP